MSDPLTDADDEASTPLTPDERAALIPSYITLRTELNEIEQIGIDHADQWAFARRRGDVLDEDFLRQLHKRMFRGVWAWAGDFSKETGRNIGLDAWEIGPGFARCSATCATGSNTRPTLPKRSPFASIIGWSGFIPSRTATGAFPASLRTS